MTKEEIIEIVRGNIAFGNKVVKIMFAIGVVFILLSVACYLFIDNGTNDNIIIAAIAGGIGSILCGSAVGLLISRRGQKITNRTIEALQYQPSSLVWAYTHEVTRNGAKTVSVNMCFRDGSTFSVIENIIPGHDVQAFLKSLPVINPKIHLGHTEELEKRYKDGLL